MPQYSKWGEFYEWFVDQWNTDEDYGAEHVVLVGQAGSGKTRLATRLIVNQPYVVVMGTKTRDPSLYDPLVAQGFVIKHKWSATDLEDPKVIFVPPLEEPNRAGLARQGEAFEGALTSIFKTGGWCVYMDEVRYLTETLNLQAILNTLWLQGRSLWITMVASTQRPVSIPLNAFEQATHSFIFRTTSTNDRQRSAEFQGPSSPVVYQTIGRLPHHEFLYVNKIEDILMRSKVDL